MAIMSVRQIIKSGRQYIFTRIQSKGFSATTLIIAPTVMGWDS